MDLFGDNPRADIFRAGDALGDGDARGDVADLGDGVLLAVLDAVRRLVGLLILGDPGGTCKPLVPGDFDRLRGEFGTDSKFPLEEGWLLQQPLSPLLDGDEERCISSYDSLSSKYDCNYKPIVLIDQKSLKRKDLLLIMK